MNETNEQKLSKRDFEMALQNIDDLKKCIELIQIDIPKCINLLHAYYNRKITRMEYIEKVGDMLNSYSIGNVTVGIY